jgi:DNA-binding MarR family transcriptional regulator
MTGKTAWRRNNIGRRLNEAVRRFETRIVEHLRQQGHDQLTLAHINLTRNLDEEGTRLSELARRASMTRQSMGELVTQVERTGLIERRPDPTDGRAKLVRFTDSGHAWLAAFKQSLELAEAEMRQELGPDAVDTMLRLLTDYVEAGPAADAPAGKLDS